MNKRSLLFTAFALIIMSGLTHAAAWKIDKSHSEVGFKVKHMVIATVTGKFTNFSGEVTFDPDNLAESKIKGVVQVASINTDNEKRDGHLKSADFFDAENYPEITFESTEIKKKGDGYVAIGKLTLRDVTKEITVPFTVAGPVEAMGSRRVGFEGSTTINRQDFGVTWNKTIDNGGLVVSDDVVLILRAELIQD